MPLALVFTSAPRGLVPGRSGYVTVARHAAMSPRLAELLEAIGTPHGAADGATFTLRRVEAGGSRWRVLSRFAAGGLDHTRRDNRIAHHLAFAEDELAALPPPADVARRWSGWISRWEGDPAFLPEASLDLRPGQPLIPCAGWREACGSGAKASWLVAGGGARSLGLSGNLEPTAWLRLLAESGALLGSAAWDVPFTTDASVTGTAGFTWRCQPTGGDIDLNLAHAQPAPEGPEARRASLGVGSSGTPRATAPRLAQASAPGSAAEGSRQPLVLALALLLAVALGAGGWLLLRKPAPPPAPPPIARPAAPSPAEIESARNLLRDQRALSAIDEAVQRDDVARAGRLWAELARAAPAFAQRNAEPTLARIRARLAASVARSLGDQLDKPEVAGDPAKAAAVAAEAETALALGAELGIPADRARRALESLRDRARLVASLDIRPTLVVPGRWVTGNAGPALPAAADFELGPEAGAEIRTFLSEGLVGGPGSVARGGIRLVAFRHLAHRDPRQPRMAEASIEPGASSVYAGETTTGGARPALSLSVGTRANAVSLNLPVRPGPDFLSSAQGLELVNAKGRRLCVVLLPSEAALDPLPLPLDALTPDPVTEALGPAPWIEPTLGSARVSGARLGLYPAGQAFPDRVIPSMVSPPSQVDTALLRLAAGTAGPMPRAELAERQRLAREGDRRQAGAPWTLRAVNLRGESVLTLAEIRD
jgi:hypothetical protein